MGDVASVQQAGVVGFIRDYAIVVLGEKVTVFRGDVEVATEADASQVNCVVAGDPHLLKLGCDKDTQSSRRQHFCTATLPSMRDPHQLGAGDRQLRVSLPAIKKVLWSFSPSTRKPVRTSGNVGAAIYAKRTGWSVGC